MKNIFRFILTGALVSFMAASCMDIDNFDAPAAKVSGRIIDKTTGQNMLLDHGTSHIRIWEKSYSLTPAPQDLAIKTDGTYNNTKLFSGTYDMLPNDGAWWPCDTLYNVPIGKKGAEVDFEVTPYLHIVDFKAELTGLELKLSGRLQAPVTEGMPQIVEIRPFLSLNQYCGAGNHIDYYYTNTYRINIKRNWSAIGTPEGEGNTTYELTLPVKAGYTYWCRLGVQIDNSYKAWNYSEIVKIEVPVNAK